MKKLRAAVIGVGYLGNFHVQKYLSLPEVEVVGLVETNPARRAEIAARYAIPVFDELAPLLGQLDLVSIVTPPAHHFEAARACLAAGIHVLVEKPVTASVAEAETLVALARAQACVFQVGHLERFNPAVLAVRRHLTKPQRIEARRLSKFQTRGTEVDVVLDLMIHDIDIVLSMVSAPLARLHASGSVVISGDIDVAHASLFFADGCVAELTASRVNREPARSMEIFQPGACIAVDYLNHTLLVSEAGGTAAAPTMSFAEESLVRTDVLMDEIRAFVAAVARGEAPPVSGEDGKRALEVAVSISQEIRRQDKTVHIAQR